MSLAIPSIANESSESAKTFLERFHQDPASVMNELPPKSNRSGVLKFSEEDISSRQYIQQKDQQRQATLNAQSNDRMMRSMAAIRGNDNPANLVDNYTAVIKNIHEIDEKNLTSASLSEQPWSDTYWPLYKGALSDRYEDPLLADAWPQDFGERYKFATVDHLPSEYIENNKTAFLSPAEKYDMLVGDENFTLTDKMWKSGKGYFDRNGSVETWMGLCHGWAPAAYMLSRPEKTLDLATPSGETVTFYPSDIKALGTLLWSNASPRVRFIGGRCNIKNPETDENGRIIEQQCFDTNPGSWHQSVVNQIGVSKRSFILDATYDYQVWNQPVIKYSYQYFNPETGETFSTAKDAIIKLASYSKDKFSSHRSSSTDSVVGIQMRMTYLVETEASHRRTDSPRFDAKTSVTYRYDLELDEIGNIIGGEWYTNRHPDFLWTPAPDARAVSYYNPENTGNLETITVKQQGSVKQGEWAHFGPYQSEGESIVVTLTGNNDADLYVHKNAQPNEDSYTCRPWDTGSNENCKVKGAGTYYVSVNGYADQSDFQLNIQYGQNTGGTAWSQDSALPADWQNRAQKASKYDQPLTAIVEQLFEWAK